MSDDPLIEPSARRIVQSIRHLRRSDDEYVSEIVLLVNEWKGKAWREGFAAGKETPPDKPHMCRCERPIDIKCPSCGSPPHDCGCLEAHLDDDESF